MNNFFDIIRVIYQKRRGSIEATTSFNIIYTKWLGYDKDNLPYLKKIVPYFYYLEPNHYFYLLYFNIPRKMDVPNLRKITKPTKKKDNPLVVRIQEVLQWSNREVKENMNILEKVILINKKYWKEELGVK
ncbi:hypothetical protein LCGC14_1896460 [marine sediment metagenome]|uniref:Uncharacterized protein n=1 Tax=marine sediment metagenome TaxID=412755 RepID=A0A0F9FY07_9ZZZZ